MNVYFRNTHQRGFGTFPIRGDEGRAAILTAAEVGYGRSTPRRCTATRPTPAKRCRRRGVPRDELCITTKVHPENYGEDRFIASVEQSLRDLRVDCVDVLLLHWPPVGGDIAPSLKLLQKALDAGLTHNIGVSNYTVAMMRAAVSIVDAPLVTNQVEFHPLLNQDRLLAGAGECGIPLSAYCSVARGEVFRHPELAAIGEGYGKSAGQVVLRWIIQKGVSAITMSTNPANIRANFDIMDFTLSSVDMARIEKLTHTGYRIVDKNVSPWAPDWD